MNGDASCSSDYIVIPGGGSAGVLDQFARDRYCGVTLGPCDAPAGTGSCAPAEMAVTSEYVIRICTS